MGRPLQACQEHYVDSQTLKRYVGLALEIRKGNSSFFWPYLKMLPTLNDYRQFHPYLAGNAILADFGQVTLLKYIYKQEVIDLALLEACFNAVKAAPKSKRVI